MLSERERRLRRAERMVRRSVRGAAVPLSGEPRYATFMKVRIQREKQGPGATRQTAAKGGRATPVPPGSRHDSTPLGAVTLQRAQKLGFRVDRLAVPAPGTEPAASAPRQPTVTPVAAALERAWALGHQTIRAARATLTPERAPAHGETRPARGAVQRTWKGALAGGALGALTLGGIGAGIGSLFGPAGTLTGALVGGAVGGLVGGIGGALLGNALTNRRGRQAAEPDEEVGLLGAAPQATFLAQLKPGNQEKFKSVQADRFAVLERFRRNGFDLFNEGGRIAFLKDDATPWDSALQHFEAVVGRGYERKKDNGVKIYTTNAVAGFTSITLRNVSSQSKEGVAATIECRLSEVEGNASFVEFKYKQA